MNSTIYESLPPSVAGAVTGKLSVRVKRLSLRDGTFAVGYSVRFEWWGQKGAAVQMACPWKSGMAETEALFPIRAEAAVLDDYLHDMQGLLLEVLDKSGKVVGKGTMDLSSLVGGGLHAAQLSVSLNSTKAGSKKTLGELQMSATTTWDRSPLEEGYLAPAQNDATPQRAERLPVAAEPNFGVSSFQRNEALTITDFSNRFSDWPTGGVGAVAAGVATSTSANNYSNNGNSTSINNKATTRAPLAHAAAKKKVDRAEKAAEKSEPNQPQTTRASKEYDPAPYSAEGENIAPTNVLCPDSMHAAATKVDTTVRAILQKAEGLLNLVKATKPSGSSSSSSSSSSRGTGTASVDPSAPLMQLSEPGGRGRVGFGLSGMPGQHTWTLQERELGDNRDNRGGAAGGVGSFSTTAADATYDLTQIEWLLRGLPDAYDTEPEYSDEAIQGIIKQGGNPPSAILFPSIYSATQRVMDKLMRCNGLQVSIQHLLVFSARFGLRRDSSHFILRPPLGVNASSEDKGAANAMEPSSHFIALPELDDEQQQPIYSDTAVRRKANKGLQRDYFVGGIDLNHHHCFPLCLTDKVVREWMEGGSDGCIQLILYGYLFPPANTAKGHAFSDPVVFGSATIPLSGLLLSDSLDAIVTADLEADQSTLASVLGRARALPQGHALLSSKPLGLTMGNVKLQLTLLSEGKAAKSRTEAEIEGVPELSKKKPKSPLLQPVVSQVVQKERIEEVKPSSDPLHAAMMYHPQEARSSIITGNITASVAVGVYGVEDILMSVPPHLAGSLSVRYKVPTSNRGGTPASPVTLSAPLRFSSPERHDGPCALLSSLPPTLRLFDISDLRVWKPPVFEIWMDLDADSGGQRVLVGLARVPDTARLSEILRINIIDVLRGSDAANVVGCLVVSLSAHSTRGAAEDMGHKLLSLFTTGGLQAERAGGAGVETTGLGNREEPLVTPSLPLFHIDAVVASELNAEDDMAAANLGSTAESFGSQEGSLRSQIEGEDHVQLGDHVLRILGEAKAKEEESEDEDVDEDDAAEEKDDLVSVIALLNPPHPLPEEDTPRLNAPPAFDQTSFNTLLGLSYIHILEVSIEGSCANVKGNLAATAPLGCYLVYRLDSPFLSLLEQASSSDARIADDGTAVKLAGRSNSVGQSRWSSVWWDGDCAVLNGRARHVFELHGSFDRAGPCFPRGLSMFVVQCDAEGNLPLSTVEVDEDSPPVANGSIIGIATVSSDVLERLLTQAGSRDVIDIQWDPVPHSEPADVHGIERVVSVSLSHHVDPFSLRHSLSPPNTAHVVGVVGACDLSSPQSVNFLNSSATPAVSPRASVTTVGDASRSRIIDVIVTIDTLIIRTAFGSTAGVLDSNPPAFSVYVMCTSVTSRAAESSLLPSVIGAACFVSNMRSLKAPGKVQWNEQYAVAMPCNSGAIGRDSSQQLATPLRTLRGAALQLSVYYRKAWRTSISPPQANGLPGSAGDGVQIGDYLVGTCVVDLSALSYVESQGVHGWYNVLDSTNHEVGQVSLKVAVEGHEAFSDLVAGHAAAAAFPPLVTIATRSTEESIREEADAAGDRSSFLDYSSSFYDKAEDAPISERVYFLDRTAESLHIGPALEGPYRLDVTETKDLGQKEEEEEDEEEQQGKNEQQQEEEQEEEEETPAVPPPLSSSWIALDGETHDDDSEENNMDMVVTSPTIIDVGFVIADLVVRSTNSSVPLDRGIFEGDDDANCKNVDDGGVQGTSATIKAPVSSATLLGYMDGGEDEWSEDEEENEPPENDDQSDASGSSLDDGGSPPRTRPEKPHPKAASTVSDLFASIIGGILHTDAVRAALLLLLMLRPHATLTTPTPIPLFRCGATLH